MFEDKIFLVVRIPVFIHWSLRTWLTSKLPKSWLSMQKSSCMTEIHKYLRVKSAHKAESALLEDLWGKQAHETALLISERLINVPLELAPPLYQGLFEEVAWATEDEVSPIGLCGNGSSHRLEYMLNRNFCNLHSVCSSWVKSFLAAFCSSRVLLPWWGFDEFGLANFRIWCLPTMLFIDYSVTCFSVGAAYARVARLFQNQDLLVFNESFWRGIEGKQGWKQGTNESEPLATTCDQSS